MEGKDSDFPSFKNVPQGPGPPQSQLQGSVPCQGGKFSTQRWHCVAHPTIKASSPAGPITSLVSQFKSKEPGGVGHILLK
jgi:hypothetical protein